MCQRLNSFQLRSCIVYRKDLFILSYYELDIDSQFLPRYKPKNLFINIKPWKMLLKKNLGFYFVWLFSLKANSKKISFFCLNQPIFIFYSIKILVSTINTFLLISINLPTYFWEWLKNNLLKVQFFGVIGLKTPLEKI